MGLVVEATHLGLNNRVALKFLAEKPDDPAKVKEFALAMFNINAFLYVN